MFDISHITLIDIINVLSYKNATAAQKVCLQTFARMVWRPLADSFAFLVFALLMAKWQSVKKVNCHIFAENLVLFLGSLVYLFGLLLLYLFSFSDFEKQYLASFERYITIYYFAWLLVLYNTFFHLVLKSKSKFMRLKVHAIFIIFALFMIVFSMKQSNNFKNTDQWQFRQSFETIANAVKQYMPVAESSRLFIVWQNTSGLPGVYLEYILVPVSVRGSSSLGAPYAGEKRFAHNVTPKAFLQEMRNYDYLLLAYTDKQFWNNYGQLFKAQPPKLTPLTSYQACFVSSGFNPIMQRGCRMREEKAYLFKIVHSGNKVAFVNVKTLPR